MPQKKTSIVQVVSLSGARVLIVEDEYYIADDLRRMLEAAGASVIGPVSTLAKAHELIDRRGFDCAVIDLNLHGESAVSIADRLLESDTSFAIATGYGSEIVPERLKHVPRIEKPFDPQQLVQVVAQLGCIRSAAD